MTDRDEADLERFFAAARDTAEPPPAHLMAAILRDGLAAQPARAPRPGMRPLQRPRQIRRLGWPQATALAACLLGGLIAGLVGPGLFDTRDTADPAADILAFYDLATETDG